MANQYNQNLRNYLAADLISQFGCGMCLLTMTWFILDKTGKNELVAIVYGVNLLCGLITSIFSGLIVDRFKKKSVIIWTNTFRGIVLTLTLILLLFCGFNENFVFLIAISNGIGWNLYFPAMKSLLQEITIKDNLLKGNSSAEIAMQGAFLAADVIGGILYKVLGFNMIISINIFTFIIATLFIRQVLVENSALNRKAEVQSIQAHFMAGVQYLSQNLPIFLLGMTMSIPFVAGSCFNVALPGYVSIFLHSDSVAYGFISMCYGIGGCIAGLMIIGLARRFSQRMLVRISFLTTIVGGLAMLVNHSVIGACIITVFFGICEPGIRILMNTVIMERIPSSHIGRSMSIWNTIGLLLQIVSTYLIGKSMDLLGAQCGFLFFAIIMSFGLMTYIYYHKIENKQYMIKA